MAERFQPFQIPSTLGQPSARGATTAISQATSGIESLANRLERFSKESFQAAGQAAQAEAVRDATIDIQKRKQKVSDIRNSGATSQEQEKQIASLVEGKTQDDFTIYGKAYNNAASSAYANQVALDAKTAAEMATVQAEGDPSAFMAMYTKFEEETVKDAPSAELAIAAKRSFLQYGSSAFKAIALDKQKRQDKLNKDAYVALTKQLESDFVMAAKNGETVAQGEIFARYTTASISAVKSGYTTEEQVNSEIIRIKKDAFVAQNIEHFRNSTDRVEYLTNFRENRELNEEETATAITKMHKMMESEQDDRDIVQQKEEADDKRAAIETKTILDSALVSSEVTEEMLEDAVKGKAITLSQADDYRQRSKTPGIAKTDSNAYLNIFSNIDLVSEEEIMNNNVVSNEDKLVLLKEKIANQKLSNQEAEKLGKWQSTVTGRQAVNSIRNHFGIFEGTFIAKIDKENQIGKDYITVQRKFFDEVQSLPMEERSMRSLEIADRLIKEYNEAEMVGTKPFLDKQEEDLQAKLEEDKEKKEQIAGQNGIIPFIRRVTGI